MHFEVHLQRRNYKDAFEYRHLAEMIPTLAESPSFASEFLNLLNTKSASEDRIDYSRFGYLKPSDVTVTKAVALPIGFTRDLDHHHSPLLPQITDVDTVILILVGVALAVTCLLSVLCCLHCRLRAEHEALSKDKVMGSSLRRMWDRFQNMRQKRRSPNVAYAKVPLSRMEDDDQLDSEEFRH